MTTEKDKNFKDIDKIGNFEDFSEETDNYDDGFMNTAELGDVDDDIAEIMKTDYAKILQNNILTSENEIMQISDNFSDLKEISD